MDQKNPINNSPQKTEVAVKTKLAVIQKITIVLSMVAVAAVGVSFAMIGLPVFRGPAIPIVRGWQTSIQLTGVTTTALAYGIHPSAMDTYDSLDILMGSHEFAFYNAAEVPIRYYKKDLRKDPFTSGMKVWNIHLGTVNIATNVSWDSASLPAGYNFIFFYKSAGSDMSVDMRVVSSLSNIQPMKIVVTPKEEQPQK